MTDWADKKAKDLMLIIDRHFFRDEVAQALRDERGECAEIVKDFDDYSFGHDPDYASERHKLREFAGSLQHKIAAAIEKGRDAD